MEIQCRVCHQITTWSSQLGTLSNDRLKQSLAAEPMYGSKRALFSTSCSHGEYRGVQSANGAWQWEWWDTDALVQEQAYLIHRCNRPLLATWNPSPMTLICICGQMVLMEGESDFFQGWKGMCSRCGAQIQVNGGMFVEEEIQKHKDLHQEAMTLWESLRPLAPKPLVVTGLLESEDV